MSRTSITILILSLLAMACQVAIAQVAEETLSTTLTVFHQKNGEYIKRGEIIGLPGVPEYIPAANEIVEFTVKEPFYQVKVRDESTGNIILSSVKMCQMVASEWHDEFILNLDEDNRFYYLSYYPQSNYCQEKIEYPITTKAFNTSVLAVTPVTGPKPLIGNFGSQKKALPKAKKVDTAVNDQVPDEKEIEEKTFFQKYWMYLLAGGFFLLNIVAAPEAPAAPVAAGRR